VKQDSAQLCPLEGHIITGQARAKMVDWMVEVTAACKCSERTYFLAVSLFDGYLRKSYKAGRFLDD
jgi:hypothetical protein